MPAALLCSTAFTILCQETNCSIVPLVTPQVSSSSLQYLDILSATLTFLQSMELTAIILAHGHTAPSIWDYWRSVPPNILNWNVALEQHFGAEVTEKDPAVLGAVHTSQLGIESRFFYSILLSDYFRQGRLQQFSSKALVCHNQQQSQAQQENLPRLLFQRLQNLPIFPLLFRFSSSTTKVNVYTRREKRLVFTQKASSNTFSFSFSFGTSRGGG